MLLALTGCGRSGMNYNLKSLEKSLLERSAEAGIDLDSINSEYGKGYNKRYRLAKGWYALGQSYSDMQKDPEAIYALLKARELFTDTLSADYASTLYLLGRHYNNRGLYDDAVNTFSTCRRLYQKLGDNIMVSMTDYNLGVAYFGKKDYSGSRRIFESLLSNRFPIR